MNDAFIIGVLEEKRRKKMTEIYLKIIMAENFPNMGRNQDIQFYKSNRLPKISIPKDLLPDTLKYYFLNQRQR